MPARQASDAAVDYLVDEKGSRIDVRDGTRIRATGSTEDAVGATSPANWWQLGLVALAIVVAILIALQIFGGTPGTDVLPGSPVAAPQVPQA